MTSTRSTLPKKWTEDFVVELRLRGVTGRDIGDALKHVESYCQDSGESPDEAFGPAPDYARSLPFAPGRLDDVSAGRMIRVGVPSFIGLVGMLLSLTTVEAWRSGGEVPFTSGWLVLLAVTVALSVAAAAWLDAIARHRVPVGIVGAAIYGAALMAPVTLTTVAFTAPVAACGAVGVALLVASGLLNARMPLRLDPVRDPTQQRSGRSRIVVALSTVATSWLFALLTAVATLIVLVVPA